MAGICIFNNEWCVAKKMARMLVISDMKCQFQTFSATLGLAKWIGLDSVEEEDIMELLESLGEDFSTADTAWATTSRGRGCEYRNRSPYPLHEAFEMFSMHAKGKKKCISHMRSQIPSWWSSHEDAHLASVSVITCEENFRGFQLSGYRHEIFLWKLLKRMQVFIKQVNNLCLSLL